MTENNTPQIDRSIYPMPSFVNMVVSDLGAAQSVYTAAGFVVLATIPGSRDAPPLAHLRRERYQDILMVEGKPAPGTTSVSFAAAGVDLDSVADRLRSTGATVAGPVDTAWFSTDVTFSDNDGNAVTLTAPRIDEQVAARTWANDEIVLGKAPGVEPFR